MCEFVERLRAIAADDAALSKLLSTQDADRFRVFHLSAAREHARLALMAKPVDAPQEHIVFWLWYWSFAFSDSWQQYSPHRDWRALYLSDDSLDFIREMFVDFLGESTCKECEPKVAQAAILSRIGDMTGKRRTFGIRRALRVRSCQSDPVISSRFDDTVLQNEFKRAFQIIDKFDDFSASSRKVLLFETEHAFGLWNRHLSPEYSVE